MSRKILWHTVAQNKAGGYLFKGDDPLYYGDDPIYRVPSIEGPSVLQHGVVGAYTVPGGWEPEQVTYDADGATISETTAAGFTLTLDYDSETAIVRVYYQGRQLGTVYIQCAPIVGVVSGDDILDPGEEGIYYHNLGPDATYTGNVPGTAFSDESGDGVVVTMPSNAPQGQGKTISFTGVCGATASKTVAVGAPCIWDPLILDVDNPATYPQIGQWIYNGVCWQKVTAYYTTAVSACTVGSTCPTSNYFLSQCNWDGQVNGAVKVYKLGAVNGNLQELTQYVWTIGERVYTDPCA